MPHEPKHHDDSAQGPGVHQESATAQRGRALPNLQARITTTATRMGIHKE